MSHTHVLHGAKKAHLNCHLVLHLSVNEDNRALGEGLGQKTWVVIHLLKATPKHSRPGGSTKALAARRCGRCGGKRGAVLQMLQACKP